MTSAAVPKTEGAERKRYCRGCFCVLDGLPAHRCPECGRPFDPDDPTTFADHTQRRNKAPLVLVTYAIPLACTLGFWVIRGPAFAEASPETPLATRLLWGLWQACGLLGWLLTGSRQVFETFVPLCAALLWAGWSAVASLTPLRDLPYSAHLVAGSLWCASGCLPMVEKL